MVSAIPNVPGLKCCSLKDLGEDYLAALIYGYQGSGKTRLASTIASVGPTLFIDLAGEHGVRSFQNSPYADNIRVIRPSSITELDDIYWKLAGGNHPFVAVVIDSLTAAQKLALRFLQNYDETVVREIMRGVDPPNMRVWGQSLEIMNDIATYWCALADADRDHPMHVVFTAQVKTIENDVEGVIERLPDVQKGAVSVTLAAPDYILWTQAESNPLAEGDETQSSVLYTVRFGAHPGYRTKARIPYDLQGKLPGILGKNGQSTDLVRLGQVLRIGGMPKPAPRPTATTTKK
jgi:hypothetical protein